MSEKAEPSQRISLVLKWVNSGGGPLICAPPSAAAKWRGSRCTSIRNARSDYARACDVLDYLGVIPCGVLDVLVLGDEPLPSAFGVAGGELVIVRWVACISAEQANDAIAMLPSQLPL